jgi:hypothetical protein
MTQEELEFEWLAPDRFMQPAERRQIRQLLRQQKLLREQERCLADEKRLNPAQRERFRVRWRASHAKLEELSADMLRRYLDVGRYSVLHVRRHDGLETLLQVLRAEVVFNDWNRRWMWGVRGRRLRKNGKLGFADASTCFDIADVRRRLLDGTWQRIRPLNVEDGSV